MLVLVDVPRALPPRSAFQNPFEDGQCCCLESNAASHELPTPFNMPSITCAAPSRPTWADELSLDQHRHPAVPHTATIVLLGFKANLVAQLRCSLISLVYPKDLEGDSPPSSGEPDCSVVTGWGIRSKYERDRAVKERV